MLLAVAAAFALFGLLQTVTDAFDAVGRSVAAAHRLITLSEVRGQPLPISLNGQIARVPGVRRVTYNASMFATWRHRGDWVGGFAVPSGYFAVLRGYRMPAAEWRAYRATRIGLLAGETLARRHHWRLGEQIPLRAVGSPRRDGTNIWTFVLTGIYRDRNRAAENNVFFHWHYFNAARAAGRNMVNAYFEWIADPHAAGRIARAVDALSVNSSYPTRTRTESAVAAQYVAHIADVALIAHAVTGAVLFTLLLLTGNTLTQALRERIAELAVLKTVGFTGARVSALMLGEAAAVCFAGGLSGLLLARASSGALLEYLWHNLGIPYRSVGRPVWFEGIALMAFVSVAVGALPAWRALRPSVVETLAAD